MNELEHEISQEWHNKRKKFALLYNELHKKYNPDTDYPSGLKAKKLHRIYNLYVAYSKFPYLPIKI